MLRLFLDAHRRLLSMALQNLWPRRGGMGGRSVKHVLVMLVFLPGLYALMLLQWLGLLLDEIFFRGYRDVPVRAPVFVLGVPRSGTTFVHEVFADDQRFTTFSSWECFFAASVTFKKLGASLIHLNRLLGGYPGRGVKSLQQWLGGPFESTHPVDLTAPEEDFFCLIPAMACFILIVPFPDSPQLWRLARFDREVSEPERSRLLKFYRSCVRRHLYQYGTDRTFLSKNASFAPWTGALLETFPDARVVCCVRDPVDATSSQLSVLADGMSLFGNPPASRRFRDRMLTCLVDYYQNLLWHGDRLPEARWQWLTLEQVRSNLAASINACYQHFGLEVTSEFAARLAERHAAAAAWRSSHGHCLDNFGLSVSEIEQRFDCVYRRFELSPGQRLVSPPGHPVAMGG